MSQKCCGSTGQLPRLRPGIRFHLDLLHEQRDEAQVARATYQNKVAHYYNETVNPRKFQVGYWVLRNVNLMTKDPTEGKLGAKWAGPYWVLKYHKKRGLSSENC
jgi:hypothetical protein